MWMTLGQPVAQIEPKAESARSKPRASIAFATFIRHQSQDRGGDAAWKPQTADYAFGSILRSVTAIRTAYPAVEHMSAESVKRVSAVLGLQRLPSASRTKVPDCFAPLSSVGNVADHHALKRGYLLAPSPTLSMPLTNTYKARQTESMTETENFSNKTCLKALYIKNPKTLTSTIPKNRRCARLITYNKSPNAR